MLVVALVPPIVGVVLTVVGWLGLTERLPRNRLGGVRTPATLRSDEAFRVANKVAGLPIMVAGLAGVAGGGAAFLMPDTGGALASTILGTAGMLVITLAGGVLGHRVAQAVPDPAPEPPAGCGGCGCGNCERSVGSNVAGMGGH